MSILHIDKPIKGLNHPAKTPPNFLGDLINVVIGFVFMTTVFWGGFAIAAYVCAVF